MGKTEKKDTLIHVEFNEVVNGSRHHYFGCIAAIYLRFTNKEVGVSAKTLYKHRLTPESVYYNNKCTIRKGSVVRSPSNRQQPIKVLRVADF